MRDDWGARAPTGITPIGASEGIFVHYTVTATGPDEAAVCRSVQAFHMGSKGWRDIAYSWLVGQSGRIYEGRGWGVAGGHTEGWNSRSHAVCWIGGDEQPTPAALAAIAAVCAEHARRYGGWVKPHRAVNSTSCPGDILTAWVAAGQPTTAPTPADGETDMLKLTNADGRTELFMIDGDGAVRNAWENRPGGIFGEWGYPVAQPFKATALTGERMADGRMALTATAAPYGVLMGTWQTSPNSGWADWFEVNAMRRFLGVR